jgi:hypothetical protein
VLSGAGGRSRTGIVLVTNEGALPFLPRQLSMHRNPSLWSGWPGLNRRSPRRQRSVLPLDYSRSNLWLREGDSNPNRLWCQRPPSCHWTIPEHSPCLFPKHTSLIHVSYTRDIGSRWLASKASNLESPRSERGVLPVTPLAIDTWLRRRESNPDRPDQQSGSLPVGIPRSRDQKLKAPEPC